MIVGIVSASKARQTGHCRSTYSTIVTGAEALPSTLPCWGIPVKSRMTEAASGSALTVVEEGDEDPPVKAKVRAMAATLPAIPAAAPSSTFGEAFGRSLLLTGGRAWAWRRRRACLPLVIAHPR